MRPLLPALLTLLWCLPTQAQSGPVANQAPDPETPSEADESFEATAAVVARRGEVVQDEPRTLLLVEPEDLQLAQPRSVGEAIDFLPGVQVQSTNRGADAPYLRGQIGPRNLILIDGLRFNNSTMRTGPSQYLSLIDPSHLERVEVVMGPGSVLYGSDAIGGTLQLFTRPMPNEVGWSGMSSVTLRHADQGMDFAMDTAGRAADSALRVGGALRVYDDVVAGGGKVQPLSGYTQGAFRVHGYQQLSDNARLALAYYGGRIRNAGRTDRLYQGDVRLTDNDDDLIYADVQVDGQDALNALRLAGYLHRTAERVHRTRCVTNSSDVVDNPAACLTAADTGYPTEGVVTEQSENLDEVLTPGMTLSGNIELLGSRLRLLTGSDVSVDLVSSSKGSASPPDFEPQEAPRGNFSDGSQYLHFGLFGHLDAELLPHSGDHRLVLGGGSRWSLFHARASGVPGVGALSYDYDGGVFDASLRWLLRDAFVLFVGFNQGFRAPNLQETTVLGDTGNNFEVPNAGLRPERAHSLEVGTRLTLTPVRVRLSQYTTFMDDVIVREAVDPALLEELGLDPGQLGDKEVVQRVNADSGRFIGFEASVEVDVSELATLWVNGSAVVGDVVHGGVSEPARRVPPPQGELGVRLSRDDSGVSIFVRWAYKQDRLAPGDLSDARICGPEYQTGLNANECEGTPGWATLNARAWLLLGDHWRFDLQGENLADVRYRIHGSGVDRPGATVTGTMTLSY